MSATAHLGSHRAALDVTDHESLLERAQRRRLTWTVLSIWMLSRIGVALTSLVGAKSSLDRHTDQVPNFLEIWNRWDVQIFAKVAHWGYFQDPGSVPAGAQSHYNDAYLEAFFPGDPLVLRVVHVFVPSWVGAGLLVSFVAGAVACVALSRLVLFEAGSFIAARNSVIFLVASPFALFLFAGYSEALFLALAVSGWYLARQKMWLPAGLLIGYAAAVRITGLFLGIAFIVEYLTSRKRDGKPIISVSALPLAIPFAAIGIYFTYLHQKTGDWNRWSHAQRGGWYREWTLPWDALHTTWGYVFQKDLNTDLSMSFLADTIMVFLGLALTIVLLFKRRWSQAVYVFTGLVALACSTYYFSISRSALLWFPAWLLLAEWSARRKWLMPSWVYICAPIMGAYVVAFTNSRWVN